jgi:hypothetical protein
MDKNHMHSQLKYSSMPGMLTLWCFALITLFGISASFGNPADPQAQSPQESFRGSFQQDRSGVFDSVKDSPISPYLHLSIETLPEQVKSPPDQ